LPDKQRIIIFGGPDRCGKTTLAREVSRVMNIPYFKAPNQQVVAEKNPDIFKLQTKWAEPRINEFIAQTGTSVVMDRGFPCDYVYSKVLGREAEWTAIWELDSLYSMMNAFLIFTLKENYDNTELDAWKKIDRNVLHQLDREYRVYAEVLTKIPTLIVHTDERKTDDYVKQIAKFVIDTEIL
jgi:thymidylate kinase